MSIKVNDKVRYRYDDTVGVVKETRNNEAECFIVWQTRNPSGGHWESVEELMVIDDQKEAEVAVEVQAGINQAQSLLEQAWKAWKGARDLADEKSSFYYLEKVGLIDVDAFGGAAEHFGWSSSSLHCA